MATSKFPETFYVEATQSTPAIKLDKENSKIEMSGRSLPENVKEFYEPVINWLNDYVKAPNDKTKIVLNFEYFNTASSKMIMDILEKLKEIQEQGKEIDVDWCYIEEDDDMLEAGEDYSEITEVPFNFISYE
ncbi:MAG: DUF1987 domain-containing protein [Bacteroidota bacterium]